MEPLDVRPLKRSRLVDAVTEQLRELILSNKLAPGTPLLQIDMAQLLGVSRTPLREAFRVLEAEGLVRISNGNNTIEVVQFSVKAVRDLYEIREVLDGLAARLAAQRGLSAELDAELGAACDAMERSTSNDFEVTEYSNAHVDFHATLMRASGNDRLVALLPVLRMSAQMLARRMDSKGGPPLQDVLDESKSDHRVVFESIRAGDGRAAEAAARRHIRKTLRSWLLEEEDAAAASGPEPGEAESVTRAAGPKGRHRAG